MLRTRIAITTLLLLGGALAAQEVPKEQLKELEADLMALLNTPITTASKKAERAIQAPSVVSLVTRDQFQAYGWTSLNDALYSLPGFGPSQDYDRRTVSSRGLFEGWNNNHMLLLVDGIPFNDNIYGSAYTWEITPITFLKKLEVVRGPGSALYGSNSTNASVQIKTLSADELRGGGEAQFRIGQRGERIYDAVASSQGDLISGVFAFSAYDTDGNSYVSRDAALREARVDDRRSGQYAWAKLEGQGALAGWQFQYHRQAWGYGTGYGWVFQIPDQGEQLQEKRDLMALSYSGKLGGVGTQEYMVRFQRHDLSWNIRFFPAGTTSPELPQGMNEVLDTSCQDWFGRGQWSFDLPSGSGVLLGVEGTRFFYSGDRTHYAVDFDLGTYTPASGVVPAGPWLEFLKDKPVLTTGVFAQFDSGELLGTTLKAVAGVRLDRMAFDYTKIYEVGRPTGSRSFSNTSPRLAVVYTPKPNLAFKAMFGSAFRAPAPSELAGANTYTLASNIEQLKPETLQTAELAVDWIVTPNLNWRTNLFRTKFKDQIAYSLENVNLSTNLYTLTTEGLETELLFGFGAWKGFVNLAYARRTDEEIRDRFVQPEQGRLTWEPSIRIKGGVIHARGPWTFSANLLHQGAVQRRGTDRGLQELPLPGVDVDRFRSAEVDSWLRVDARAAYTFRRMTMAVVVQNLFDSQKIRLIKPQAYPFDYQGEGRKASVVLRVGF